MLSLLACCIGCAATFKPAIQPKQKNVPRNGDISIPLRPSMCNPICTSANFVILSLVSAPIACFRRAFRTRRLALAVHVARDCGGGDRWNGGVHKVVDICDLAFENVHSHIQSSGPRIEATMAREKTSKGGCRIEIQTLRGSRLAGMSQPVLSLYY